MVRRGFLERYEAGFMKSHWKSRWFILSDNCLYMFDNPEDEGLFCFQFISLNIIF